MSEIFNEDCLIGMRKLPDNSIDAIVTDPPYGLSFMSKKWDYDVPKQEIWEECLRVLKPGGYLLAFAGTRTQHRMAVRIEDAGFEIRDMIAWVYGSGFPKSLNIGKAVDKMQGNEREEIGLHKRTGKETGTYGAFKGNNLETKGASDWEGWGTALKPAFEPITVARKPIEGTVADNCLKWGVGGINIDGCRVGTEDTYHYDRKGGNAGEVSWKGLNVEVSADSSPLGRFPANFIHDGSEEVLDKFPHSKSGSMKKPYTYTNNGYSLGKPTGETKQIHEASEGSASRFFYCAKASKSERNAGCEELEEKFAPKGNNEGRDMSNPKNHLGGMQSSVMQNNHPTVKPIKLMEYLVKLVSREGHIILDPFAGSGSTCIACVNLGRKYIGYELDKGYFDIAKHRIGNARLEALL